MAKTLSERFNAALGSNARAADVEALIPVVREALTAAERERAEHHRIAIDVRSDDATADAAADAESKATRRITRLSSQIDQLADRAKQIREDDADKAAEVERAAAIAERDELVADLKAEWPLMEAKMLAFILRIIISDKRVGAPREASAEALARGCSPLFQYHGTHIDRLVDMQVPAFSDGLPWTAWPRPRPEHDLLMISEEARRERLASLQANIRDLEAAQ